MVDAVKKYAGVDLERCGDRLKMPRTLADEHHVEYEEQT